MEANFGRLSHAALDLQPGLNVITAPNESGKSTWCSFIRNMLYGLSTPTRGALADKNRYAPWDGSAMQDLARGGAEPNAYTSNAVTAYYFDCTEHFYENLRILLSFVSVPYFTDESVEKEQGIIAQEIGMIEDNPEWQG